MSNIVLIATSDEMKTCGDNLKKTLTKNSYFKICVGTMDEAVKIAQSLDEEETDVLICRGASSEMINDANIGIPLIDMRLSDTEVMGTIREALKFCKKSEPRIAYVGYTQTYVQIKAFLDATNVEVIHYNIHNIQDIYKLIPVLHDKVDVIVGGRYTCSVANDYNIPSTLVQCSQLSVDNAYRAALNLQRTILEKKKQTEEQKVIINSINDAIISINAAGDIRVFNAAAKQIFGSKASDIEEMKIYQLCPQIQKDYIKEVFTEGKKKVGHIIEIDEKKYIFYLNPVVVKNRVTNVIISLQGVEELQKIEAQVRRTIYQKGNVAQYTFENIMGISQEISHSIAAAQSFAQVDSNILILGETGVGKELFAQSIHNASTRRDGPFVAINCGAIPRELIESELFGYEDGAFTGAKKGGKIGLFELAHKGTIFLDEISEMDPYGQVILLRALQERQVRHVGGDRIIPVDVRIIAACNVQLYSLVRQNRFRKDLFYRLSVLVLNVPALRNRHGDISHLAKHFIRQFNKEFHKTISFAPSALEEMERFEWDGNIRQLRNFCERIVAIAPEQLLEGEFIRREITDSFFFLESERQLPSDLEKEERAVLIKGKAFSREQLQKQLALSGGNKSVLSRQLGISRSSLYRFLHQLGIDKH